MGTGDGAVLIPGKGGSGKSSTALTCLGAACRLGDDYVGIGPIPSARVLALCTAKLAPPQAARFPDLAKRATVGREATTRRRYSLAPELASQLRALSLASAAPRSPPAGTSPPWSRRCRRACRGDDTISQIPHSAAYGGVRQAHDRAVPCAALALGTDHAGISEAVAQRRAVTPRFAASIGGAGPRFP